MSDVIFLSNVRLSFPHLVEPQRNENTATGQVRITYNTDLLMPESDPGFQQFMHLYKSIIEQNYKENAPVVMNMILADRKLRCFGRGEEKINKTSLKVHDGYLGNMYLTTISPRAPQMIQSDGKPVDPANTMAYQALARKMYGGCRVNAAIKPWMQKNSFGTGIRCELIAIQFANDDKPLGDATPDVSGLFGAVAQTSSAADMFGASPAPAELPSFFK